MCYITTLFIYNLLPYFKESLVECLLVVLPVLPEDYLAEVREVNPAIAANLIGHVDSFLLSRVQTKRFHRTQHILKNLYSYMQYTVLFSNI